jgi:hypothetical protein
MGLMKNPYTLKVDIRYVEHLLNSYKELKAIIYGKYKDDKDKFREAMMIHERNIRQLQLMIREYKREQKI